MYKLIISRWNIYSIISAINIDIYNLNKHIIIYASEIALLC